MTEELLREREGHVEILTINRPEARNAINLATAQALSAALDACALDDDVWVVVLTASGDKAFSAGMDLKAFARGEFPATDQGFGGITERHFPKPLICAANGSAFAGGFEMLLSCDLVVAAEHAVFGIPEVQRGLIAGAGGLVRLPRRIARAVALEMALTGEPLSASRALDVGLVNRVVAHEQVLATAMELAQRICQNAPLAVRTSKRVMLDAMELDEVGAWELNNEAFAQIASSPDALEGAIAFAEKRPPQWQGR
ncbi:MAG: crotonase/enoyl-CoA hydratase family protein [Acidobacteriota bacterium]|nr:crotonase/enoyl-CoA hydratase family protein [Acidobacteriota bacterium]MDE3031599.1 crotonase/enoyl-CoA hydratase family protein [Acidobacteriota bacterium]MDE3093402.1 crotonase/enoyl-CoA hydratase family protein [Acidobacteriota bacterium]MDE3139232.1 crotonase/enoyl-CoA hydratase family protein [Acidobacteriota bacterium]MDE3146159.1 crotonase/enoyl-CoA hydratase family protein [Acidobacteriota bacterium]